MIKRIKYINKKKGYFRKYFILSPVDCSMLIYLYIYIFKLQYLFNNKVIR